MTRRSALRKSSLTLLTAGGVGGFSTMAAADPSGDDGPTVGTSGNSPAPITGGGSGGGYTDEEWNEFLQEYDFQASITLPGYENPGGIELAVCYYSSSAEKEVCTNTGSSIQYGSRDCGSTDTPALYSVDYTVSTYQSENLETQIEFWLGYDANTDCLWVGNEQAGICTKLGCDASWKLYDLTTDPGPWTSLVREVEPFIEGNEQIVVNGTGALTGMAIMARIGMAVGAGYRETISTGTS